MEVLTVLDESATCGESLALLLAAIGIPDGLPLVRDKWCAIGYEILFAGQEDHGGNSGGRTVGGQRSRCVAGRGANDGPDVRPPADNLPDRRNQDGHAQVFERAAVTVAGLLDPQ